MAEGEAAAAAAAADRSMHRLLASFASSAIDRRIVSELHFAIGAHDVDRELIRLVLASSVRHVDLLELLTTIARKGGHHDEIVQELLDWTWPADRLVATLAVLADMEQVDAEHMSRIASVVLAMADTIPSGDYPGLIKHCLALGEVYADALDHELSWIDVHLTMVANAPVATLPNVLFVIESTVLHCPDLAQRLIDRIAEKTAALCMTDLCQLVILSASRPHIDPVDSQAFAVITNAMQSHDLSVVWKEAMPCLEDRSSILISFAEMWIESSSKQLNTAGQNMVAYVFSSMQSARGSAMLLVVSAISDHNSALPSVQRRFVAILDTILVQYARCIDVGTFLDWFRYCTSLHVSVARRVISLAVSHLASISNQFLDGAIILFRKLLLSRTSSDRALAVFGLCQILQQQGDGSANRLPIGAQIELVSAIETSLGFPLDIRQGVFSSLHQILISKTALAPEAFSQIHRMLNSRLQRYCSVDKVGHKFLMLRCFEDTRFSNGEEQPGICLRELIVDLVHCALCSSVRNPSFPTLTTSLISDLTERIMNFDSLLDLTFPSARLPVRRRGKFKVDIKLGGVSHKALVREASDSLVCDYHRLYVIIGLCDLLASFPFDTPQSSLHFIGVQMPDLCVVGEIAAELYSLFDGIIRTQPEARAFISQWSATDASLISARCCRAMHVLDEESDTSCLGRTYALQPLQQMLVAWSTQLTIQRSFAVTTSSSSSSTLPSVFDPNRPCPYLILRLLTSVLIEFKKTLPWAPAHDAPERSIQLVALRNRIAELHGKAPRTDIFVQYRTRLLELGSSLVNCLFLGNMSSLIDKVADQITFASPEFPLPQRIEVSVPTDIMIVSWVVALIREFQASSIEISIAECYVALIDSAMPSPAVNVYISKLLHSLTVKFPIKKPSLLRSILVLSLRLSPVYLSDKRVVSLAARAFSQSDNGSFGTSSMRATAIAVVFTACAERIALLQSSLRSCLPTLPRSKYTRKASPTAEARTFAWESLFDSSQSLWAIFSVINIVIRANEGDASNDDRFECLPPRSAVKFLLILARSFGICALVCSLLQRLISLELESVRGKRSQLDTAKTSRRCFQVIDRVVQFVPVVLSWFNQHRSLLPMGKREADIHLRLSTFEEALRTLVLVGRNGCYDKEVRELSGNLERLVVSRNDETAASEATRQRKSMGKRPRRRQSFLRSRVSYIDQALLEEGNGSDAYADLEDWIVD